MNENEIVITPSRLKTELIADRTQACCVPSCLKTELPIEFHGLYNRYCAENPCLGPRSTPEIDLIVAADTASEVMGLAIAEQIEDTLDGSLNLQLRHEVAHVFREGGGYSTHWKLWRVTISRETLSLAFAHRETKEVENIHLTLNAMGNIRLTFRIIPEARHIASNHKLYLDYTRTSWQTAELKVAEWRQGIADIAMMAWYLNTSCMTLANFFTTNPLLLKHLLGPVESPAES